MHPDADSYLIDDNSLGQGILAAYRDEFGHGDIGLINHVDEMTPYNDVPAASNSELEAKGYVWTFDGYIKPAEEAEFSFSGWLENTYGDVNDYMRDYRITNDVYFEGGWLGDSVEFVNNKLINPVIDNTLGLGLQLLKEADSLLFEDMQLPPIWGRYTAVPDLISEFGMSARYSAGALLSLGVKVPDSANRIIGPLPEGLNPVPKGKYDFWTGYLSKRGVQFEIGTEKANTLLAQERANGLFRQNYNWETNTYTPTIYLPENPNASVFYEEGLHALDYLRGTPRTMGYGGVSIDAWEFRAKSILLNSPNRLSYEEALMLERHLDLVKQNKY
jgi:hypothetical protein